MSFMKKRITFLFRQTPMAAIGGFSITVVGIGAAMWIGETSGYKAQRLLEQALPNMNTLCNTIILASATILALLLTLLGLSSGIDLDLKKSFYVRVQQIAFFDTILFVVTMLIFLALNFPVDQSKTLPALWFQGLYYTTLGATAVVGGMIVTVVLLLYETVSSLIQIVGYGKDDHPMLEDLEEDPHSKADSRR